MDLRAVACGALSLFDDFAWSGWVETRTLRATEMTDGLRGPVRHNIGVALSLLA